ncbi:MAG: DUF4105 domain-containing protein [Bdellovibrio sp.]|nr:DUF4105 domain-containing protein [Bdellovibrio sp.]
MKLAFSVAFLMSFSSVSAWSSDQVLNLVEQKHLAEDRQWQKLLHFEKSNFGKFESQIDSEDFFFSPHGKTNYHEELRATVKAFFEDPQVSDSFAKAQCRFPARYRWLKKKLQNETISWPDAKCERFEAYRNAVVGEPHAQQSLSLVFSSYYLNNPSSAFGHTFIRINKAPSARDGKRYELLDYGVNYAASVDTDNALVYAFKGLFGMFPGRFTSMPYYFKVREYNNSESRDLWEYDLNLDSDAAQMLVAHIWELGPAKIDYWYLTENCSYEMFTLLEAADPKVDLSSKLDRFVIPSDTTRVLFQESSLVKNVHYRPAIRTEFENRVEILTLTEKSQLELLVKGGELNANSSTAVLDAYMDYLDYRFSKEIQDETSAASQRKMAVLALRSQRSDGDMVMIKLPADDQKPHLAHPSGRWGVGAGYSDEKTGMAYFSHRFALHDRLDPQWGYPTYSQISILDTDFSYSSSYQDPADKHLEVENFALFEVKSLSPYTMFEKSRSWQVKLGMERVKNENIAEQMAGVFRGGIGYTGQFQRLDLTAHLIGEVNYAGTLPEDNLWAGLGVWTEARYSINSLWQVMAELTYERQTTFDIRDYWKGRVSTQWSPTKEWGLRLSYNNLRFDQEYQLLSYFYY